MMVRKSTGQIQLGRQPFEIFYLDRDHIELSFHDESSYHGHYLIDVWMALTPIRNIMGYFYEVLDFKIGASSGLAYRFMSQHALTLCVRFPPEEFLQRKDSLVLWLQTTKKQVTPLHTPNR